MSQVQIPASRRMVLHDIDWKTYTRLLRVFAERPGIRLAYDRGDLEMMSPLHEHESDADFLGRMVVVLTEELGYPLKAGRSTTFRRRKQQRGIEPDHSYWIASEPRVRGKRRINLRTDPPADLAIEVDVRSSSLDRMGIYAALRVPEVWRLDDGVLSFHLLQPNGTYQASGHSGAFPLLTPGVLMRYLVLRSQLDENAVIAQFRVWVRQHLVGGGSAGP
jgi:Uma2 family endonuclease